MESIFEFFRKITLIRVPQLVSPTCLVHVTPTSLNITHLLYVAFNSVSQQPDNKRPNHTRGRCKNRNVESDSTEIFLNFRFINFGAARWRQRRTEVIPIIHLCVRWLARSGVPLYACILTLFHWISLVLIDFVVYFITWNASRESLMRASHLTQRWIMGITSVLLWGHRSAPKFMNQK